jgi:hypothetical protein
MEASVSVISNFRGRTRATVAVGCLLLLASGASPVAAASTPNLIGNPGAEMGAASNGATVGSIPKWTRTTGTASTVVRYGAKGFPKLTTAGPPNRGQQFFAGGPGTDPGQVLVQVIPLARYHSRIAQGGVTFKVSGWFGGKGAENDMAGLEVDFKDVNGALVNVNGISTTIGNFNANARGGVTKLMKASATGSVPSDAATIYLQLIFDRTDGTYDNGYADNLSLTLQGV